jgi:hypothetical protein
MTSSNSHSTSLLPLFTLPYLSLNLKISTIAIANFGGFHHSSFFTTEGTHNNSHGTHIPVDEVEPDVRVMSAWDHHHLLGIVEPIQKAWGPHQNIQGTNLVLLTVCKSIPWPSSVCCQWLPRLGSCFIWYDYLEMALNWEFIIINFCDWFFRILGVIALTLASVVFCTCSLDVHYDWLRDCSYLN